METVQPIRNKKSLDEMKEVLFQQSYRDYFLFIFGINSALRISDILKLKVSDVKDKDYITLREQKTNKANRFRINKTLKGAVADYTKRMEDNGWLFPSRKGDKAITRVQAYRVLNKASDKIGLKEVGTHTLRKTYGYHFYQKTKDVAMLQNIFNHSAPSVTLRYIGINQDMMDEAMDDFGL